MKLEHVAVAVRSLESSCRLFEALLGAEPTRRRMAEQGVEAAMFETETARIELISPTDENHLSRFLQKRGEGLHHVALGVSSLEETLSRLGLEPVDGPREGFEGRVCFLDPKDTGGVLIELVERNDE